MEHISDYVELLFGVGIIGAGIYYSLLGISMIRLIKSRKVHNINTCTAVAIGAVLLLANISAILYNLFYILVYMLFIYKVVFFSNRKLMIVNGKYL